MALHTCRCGKWEPRKTKPCGLRRNLDRLGEGAKSVCVGGARLTRASRTTRAEAGKDEGFCIFRAVTSRDNP